MCLVLSAQLKQTAFFTVFSTLLPFAEWGWVPGVGVVRLDGGEEGVVGCYLKPCRGMWLLGGLRPHRDPEAAGVISLGKHGPWPANYLARISVSLEPWCAECVVGVGLASSPLIVHETPKEASKQNFRGSHIHTQTMPLMATKMSLSSNIQILKNIFCIFWRVCMCSYVPCHGLHLL